MGKRNSKRIIESIVDVSVCANECTGALQHVSVDPEEVAQFHAEYIGENKKSK